MKLAGFPDLALFSRSGASGQTEAMAEEEESKHLTFYVDAGLAQAAKTGISFDPATRTYSIANSQLAAFLLKGIGPPEVTFCNLSGSYKIDKKLVGVNRKISSKTPTYEAHSEEDEYYLTAAGETARRNGLKSTKKVVNITFKCTGTPRARNGSRGVGGSTPTCERTLCSSVGVNRSGNGKVTLTHDPDCKNRACQCCSFKLNVSGTLTQVSEGILAIQVSGSHVTPGKIWQSLKPHELSVPLLTKLNAVAAAMSKGSNTRASADLTIQQQAAAQHPKPKQVRGSQTESLERPEVELIDYFSSYTQGEAHSSEFPFSALVATSACAAKMAAAPVAFPKAVASPTSIKHAKDALMRCCAGALQGRGGGQASRMLRLLLVQRGPSPSRVHLAIALPQAPGIPGSACTHAPDTQRPPLWRGVFVNAPRSPCSERVRT